MNCPRCKATIGPLPNPDGIISCPGCGSRLMTRSAAIRSQGGARKGNAPAPPEAAPRPFDADELPPPSATLPPTPAMLLGIPPRRREGAPAVAIATPEAEPAAAPPRPAPPSPGTPASPKEAAGGGGPAADTLALVLHELRELRALQERILDRLEGGELPSRASVDDGDERGALSPIRARQQKTVVLIDDDPRTRDAAVAELLQADVPVRAFESGRAGIAAIAEEKPDVIVLELGLAGEMAGRDVVNMIKSTMEWVDVPIVLWTREPVSNQKEARLVHGADEVVPKASGAPALVARVIALFRRVH